MTKWADYCISKLSVNDDNRIDTIIVYSDDGEKLSSASERNRSWMISQVNNGKSFCTIRKNVAGGWVYDNKVVYNAQDDVFSWNSVPKNTTKRKAFVSYYHKDDQAYRNIFENLFDDLLISKSVVDGDIDPDNSADYTKMLIQNEYLNDTTILIVLIGEKTYCRKHIDWEIYGALDYKVGDKYAGILGLFLPSHSSFGKTTYSGSSIPERLRLNHESGYAIFKDWTEDRVKLQEYVELAIANRENDDRIVNKSLLQMTKNKCE
jgi:hypothetical protein